MSRLHMYSSTPNTYFTLSFSDMDTILYVCTLYNKYIQVVASNSLVYPERSEHLLVQQFCERDAKPGPK